MIANHPDTPPIVAPARLTRRFYFGFALTAAAFVLAGLTRTFFLPIARQTFTAEHQQAELQPRALAAAQSVPTGWRIWS